MSPARENPVPVIESDLIVRGVVPVDVRVRDLEREAPTETSPNVSVEELKLSVGTEPLDGFNLNATLFDDPSAVAETVTV